jgi:hypothetical protein
MPRKLFEQIGPFDSVRVGADAEILARTRLRYGPKSIKGLEVCHGLGLHHENSLTQSGVAAFDEFRYSPVRLGYTEAWLAWHLGQLREGNELRVVHGESERKFSVPEEILPGANRS